MNAHYKRNIFAVFAAVGLLGISAGRSASVTWSSRRKKVPGCMRRGHMKL